MKRWSNWTNWSNQYYLQILWCYPTGVEWALDALYAILAPSAHWTCVLVPGGAHRRAQGPFWASCTELWGGSVGGCGGSCIPRAGRSSAQLAASSALGICAYVCTLWQMVLCSLGSSDD